MTDDKEREHCERATKPISAGGLCDPVDVVDLLMRERQAARAEVRVTAAEIDALRESWDALLSAEQTLHKVTKNDLHELQSKHERLVAAAQTFTSAVEAVLAHAESPKTGMQVPFHGDFVGAQPSVLSRLRWHMRNIHAALSAAPPAPTESEDKL